MANKILTDINLIALIESETGQKFNKQNKICCPFHKEDTPSFSVHFDSNANKEKYKCFGCEKTGDALDFIQEYKNMNYNQARECLGLPIEKSADEKKIDKIENYIKWQLANQETKGGYKLKGIFPFVGHDNKPAYYKAKFLKPDGSKECSYYHFENGNVVNKRGTDEIPYNLFNVLQAIKDNRIIVITEGEKDSNTVNSIFKNKQYIGTSIKGVKDLSVLRDANIYVCGDTGTAGAEYIQWIKKELFQYSKAFKIINFTGIEDLGDNKDVTDWIESGHTKEELLEAFKNSLDLKLDEYIKSYGYSNKGILDRFAGENRDNIKYVNDIGMYIFWDNKKWSIEDDKRLGHLITDFIYEVIDNIEKYIGCLKQIGEEDNAKAFTAINTKLKSLSVVKVLKDNFINVSDWKRQKDLDSDNDILNCQNGILNLKTLELEPHDKEKYCTKIANVNYDPAAVCPNFFNSLSWIFPNEDTRRELQKAYGYSLGGNMGHQVFFIVLGKGENGKSTIMDPLNDLLGDYHNSLNARSLKPREDNTAASSDLAKLIGSRFVISSEISKKQSLDDGLLKTLAVGEEINARFLRQNEFTYKPNFKLWIPTNTLPVIVNTEHGFWRRIIIFPCKNKPKKRIKDFYKDYIKPNELPGVLNWALKGLKMLNEEGFTPTDEMLEALQEYKSTVNPIEDFVTQCCNKDDSLKVPTSDLLQYYNDWAFIEGHSEIKIRTFRDRLIDMGFEVKKSNGNRSYTYGLSLIQGINFNSQQDYEKSLMKMESKNRTKQIIPIQERF